MKLLSLILSLFFIQLISAQIHRRFEYKYSFKPPYLAQKDSTVPFWTYGGNAIASSENIRIVPSLRSQKGAAWTKTKTEFDWWEIDVVFRVSGRGRIGADGLAIWYVAEPGDYNGEVFGSSDKWNGLGVFFDSFDNDGKHNNPYIYAVLNDGTLSFDHKNDGGTQQLSGCLRDFRNKPFATRAKIEYYQNTLTVLFHNGMTNNEQDYEVCLRAENVHMPKRGYFGISAATGGLADDHDVFHFLTTSLHPAGEYDSNAVPQGEQEKLSQEYQEYQKKLEQQKIDYRKEHPDEAKEDVDDWFESDNQRELRQIWQAQSSTTEVLKELSRKLDEVIGRQERTLGLLSVGGQQVQPGGQAPPPPSGQQQYIDTIRRHEVDSLMSTQTALSNTMRELKTQINDLNQRTETVIQNQKHAGGSTGSGYEMHTLVSEMRDGMNQVKNGMAAMGAKVVASPQVAPCPTQSCLGLTQFLIGIMVHLLIVVGYSMYRDNKDAQAKKFY